MLRNPLSRKKDFMKLKIKLASVLFPAAALVVAAPPALASAAPAPHAGSSAVTTRTSGGSVPISMEPGTHTVSETIPISSPSAGVIGSPHSASQGNGSGSGAISPMASSPQIQVRVGSGNCAGFNGEEKSYIDGYDTDPGGDTLPLWALQVWGIEWNNCGTNTKEYTYVKYSAALTENDAIDPTAPNAHSVGVNSIWPTGLFAPGNVYITACLGGDGWLCGRSAGPLNNGE
jgi:hypothetical protein